MNHRHLHVTPTGRVVLFAAQLLAALGAAIGANPIFGGPFQDSSVGKSAQLFNQMAQLSYRMPTLVHRWDQNAEQGKPTTALASLGPPPRGDGPGLRFDTSKIFYVYSDLHASVNHFAPSGWMGDYGDIRIRDAVADNPADGRTCMEFQYRAEAPQGFQWAGVYWQEPVNNWGNKPGGFNLAKMKQLTFWARGARGNEKIDEFKVGGILGDRPDTGEAKIGPIYLTREWQQYRIDLSEVDLSKISGGFAWAVNRKDNPRGLTFYLDEIRYEQ